MKVIAQTEQQNPIPATPSTAPLSLFSEQEEIAIDDNTRIDQISRVMPHITSLSKRTSEGGDRFSRFLPCHYFDYIGGTSTGG